MMGRGSGAALALVLLFALSLALQCSGFRPPGPLRRPPCSSFTAAKAAAAPHWTFKTPLLEESLDYLEANFGLQVTFHKEFGDAVDADDPWSETHVASANGDLRLRLLYNYNTTHYRRNSALRYIAMRRSAYCGPPLDEEDADGEGAFLDAPNFWVRLVGDGDAGAAIGQGTATDSSCALAYVSLTVTNLARSLQSYSAPPLLAVPVAAPPGAQRSGAGSSVLLRLGAGTGACVELVQGEAAPADEEQQEEGEEEEKAGGKEASKAGAVAQPAAFSRLGVALPAAQSSALAPGAVWADPDGHEFVLSPELVGADAGAGAAVGVGVGAASIDWAARAERQARLAALRLAQAEAEGGHGAWGPAVRQLDARSYAQTVRRALRQSASASTNTIGSGSGSGVAVVMLFSPWCPRCEALRPKLEALAACLARPPTNTSVLSLDAADRRFTYLHPDDLALQSMLGWARREGFPSLFVLGGSGLGPGPVEVLGAFEGRVSVGGVRQWLRVHLAGRGCEACLDQWEPGEGEGDEEGSKLLSAESGSDDDDDDDDDDCDKCEL